MIFLFKELTFQVPAVGFRGSIFHSSPTQVFSRQIVMELLSHYKTTDISEICFVGSLEKKIGPPKGWVFHGDLLW